MSTPTKLTGFILIATLAGSVIAADFGPANAPTGAARLVPDGAWAVVYTPSIKHLLQEITPLAQKADPASSQQLAMAPMMLGMLATSGESVDGHPAPPAKFHLDRPVLVAFGPVDHETQAPNFTLIMSADKAGDVRPQPYGPMGQMHTTHASGSDYVSFSTLKYEAAASANALCDNLFQADLSINVDQAAVVKAYGPQIEGMLAMLSSQSPFVGKKETDEQRAQAASLARIQAANAKQLRMFLDGFDTWSVGIDLDGTKLDTLMQYVLTSDSAFPRSEAMDKEGMEALCRRVPNGFPIVAALGSSSLVDMLDLSMDFNKSIYSPEVQAKLKPLMPIFKKTMSDIRSGMAIGMGFGEKGVSIVEVVDVDNTADYLKLTTACFDALAKADLGLSVKDLPMVLGDGKGYTMTIDAQKMMNTFGMGDMSALMQSGGPDGKSSPQAMMESFMGGDSVELRYITHGDDVSIVGGNDRRLVGKARKALKNADGGSALIEAIDAAWASPTWALSMEVRLLSTEMYHIILAAAGPARVMLPTKLPEGNPVPLLMAGSVNDHGEQVRIKTDLADWMDWVDQIQQMKDVKAANAAG